MKKTELSPEQISEIVFEEIENHLSPKMTFKDENELSITFTWGYATGVPESDMRRVVSVCALYSLPFIITPRVSGDAAVIDVKIYKD